MIFFLTLRTTKKRGREHNNNNNSTVSKRVLLMPPDQELWINKHQPVTAESLAVHTKKVRRPWKLELAGFLILIQILSPNFWTSKEPKNQFQGTNSARLCSLAGRYDNPVSTRFLVHTDCWQIPAQLFWSMRINQRVYWMIYRGPAFPAVVWFGSCWRERWGKSQIIRQRARLVLYKLFNRYSLVSTTQVRFWLNKKHT